MSCVWRIADSGEISNWPHTRCREHLGSTASCSSSAPRSARRPSRSTWCEGGNTFLELANLPAQSHVSEGFSISIRGEPLVVRFAAVLFKRFNSITTRNPVQMGFLVTTTHGAATFKSKRGCEKSAELELAAFKTKPRDHYCADRYVLSGVVRPAHAVRP
jgi:hypothetical protein